MYNKDIDQMKKSIASKFMKVNQFNTTIKISEDLKLPETSLSNDKRKGKKIPRSKRK